MGDYKIRLCLFLYGFHNGGVEKVFENYFSHMERSIFDLHAVVYLESDPKREKLFKDMGFTVHKLSLYKAHEIKLRNVIEHWELFKNNKFDIVHCNMPENILPILFAKIFRVKLRILHSHNDYNYIFHKSNWLIKEIYSKVIRFNANNANQLIACGNVAAITAFGKKSFNHGKVLILHNAIDVEKFSYNKEKREIIRSELGINDAIFVGHIGRFETDQKNQEFLIKVFERAKKSIPNLKLIFIGDGKNKQAMEKAVSVLGYADDVIFSGTVNNVYDYLQAIDIFCFPSRYEGLGIVAVEAQAAGLPCILSDRVPKEVKICDDVTFLSIENSYDEWVNALIKYSNLRRVDTSDMIIKAGYEINQVSEQLLNLYLTATDIP